MTRKDAVDNLLKAFVTAVDRDQIILDALAAFEGVGLRVVRLQFSLRIETIEVPAREVGASSLSQADANFLHNLRIVPDVIGDV
jgi:hypothetical protein